MVTDQETFRMGLHGIPCAHCPRDKASHTLVLKKGKWYTTCDAIPNDANNSLPMSTWKLVNRSRPQRKQWDVDWQEIREALKKASAKKALLVKIPADASARHFSWAARRALKSAPFKVGIYIVTDKRKPSSRFLEISKKEEK